MSKRIKIMLALLALLLTAAASAPALESIDWWVMGGGGGALSQGDLELESVIGQTSAGTGRAGEKDLCAGFLCAKSPLFTFMPLLEKNAP
jgi:hypothetical protein